MECLEWITHKLIGNTSILGFMSGVPVITHASYTPFTMYSAISEPHSDSWAFSITVMCPRGRQSPRSRHLSPRSRLHTL